MLPNIFWSRTDYISGAYATKMVAISSPVMWILLLPKRKNNKRVRPCYRLYDILVRYVWANATSLTADE